MYQRTYYDLHQIALARMNVRLSRDALEKAYKAAIAFTSDANDDTVVNLRNKRNSHF